MTGPGDPRAPAPSLLVVDDDEAVLRAFERTFRRSYDIRTASSGGLALAALEEREVDVLITDLVMPVMSGIDLLREVVVHHPAVARLMLTAHAEVEEVVAWKQQGLVSAVLMKPWTREEVEGAVTRALRLASMRRAVAGLQEKVGPLRP
jgi:DNA-binding NtrC family response regulator